MASKQKWPLWVQKAVRAGLGIEGLLHVAELITSIYEEAYLTAGLLVVSSCILLSAWIVLGDTGHHHGGPDHICDSCPYVGDNHEHE